MISVVVGQFESEELTLTRWDCPRFLARIGSYNPPARFMAILELEGEDGNFERGAGNFSEYFSTLASPMPSIPSTPHRVPGTDLGPLFALLQ
jgi:hypothetical protein